VKLQDRVPNKWLRDRLGLDHKQNSLRWYEHVLRKEDNVWVKKCTVSSMKCRVPGQEVDQRKLGEAGGLGSL